uniref:Secreted protein n=1 Tax=Chromera velia CCMP2878 TaxID=1169474 RepID=A0A0G4I3I8_9ALVE|eukprot:Cvel_1759.t1-p1 / transcript=Cvel_1759.t1 / gene=Cvel_1759 / organism=Chromera_velia_CCMP2878 / gene_product=hypothetical protein / transcript_product=hypothetical protein / location=Cvel_scaffold64:81492-81893(+) / protein_length=134 / sequence_SO=supercontig / SO=protein_coding / is_pseudo=false
MFFTLTFLLPLTLNVSGMHGGYSSVSEDLTPVDDLAPGEVGVVVPFVLAATIPIALPHSVFDPMASVLLHTPAAVWVCFHQNPDSGSHNLQADLTDPFSSLDNDWNDVPSGHNKNTVLLADTVLERVGTVHQAA